MTLDLRVLSSPEASVTLAKQLLRVETKMRKNAGDAGWISADDLKDIITEEVVKDTDEASVAKRVSDISDLMHLKSTAVQIFGPPMQACFKLDMSIKDTVFAAIFAAANVNVAAELSTENPHLNLHSREDFLKLAALAHDYMQLHHMSLLRSQGRVPTYDN